MHKQFSRFRKILKLTGAGGPELVTVPLSGLETELDVVVLGDEYLV